LPEMSSFSSWGDHDDAEIGQEMDVQQSEMDRFADQKGGGECNSALADGGGSAKATKKQSRKSSSGGTMQGVADGKVVEGGEGAVAAEGVKARGQKATKAKKEAKGKKAAGGKTEGAATAAGGNGPEAGDASVGEGTALTTKPKKPRKKRKSKFDPPPPPRNDHVCEASSCGAIPRMLEFECVGNASSTIQICVDSDPVALKRPRHVTGGHTYDPNFRDKRVFLDCCRLQLPDAPLEGPVGMSMVFELPRAKQHFYTPKGKWGGMRPTAPKHPDKVPDLDNLVKFVLDALNEKAFKDDRQICQILAKKTYRACAGPGRTHVFLSGLERRVGEAQDATLAVPPAAAGLVATVQPPEI